MNQSKSGTNLALLMLIAGLTLSCMTTTVSLQRHHAGHTQIARNFDAITRVAFLVDTAPTSLEWTGITMVGRVSDNAQPETSSGYVSRFSMSWVTV